MSAAPTKFNLRPQERRLVAFVGIVLFVVLNIWLVWPHFGDWSRLKLRQERARRTYEGYRNEIARVPGYRVKLRQLESSGSSVVPEEQDLNLVLIVNEQVAKTRLTLGSSDPRPRVSAGTQTNRFFEEQYLNLHVTSGNEELVNFLTSLTTTNSMIRVKDLSIKADNSQTRLDSHMTLVASYQRSARSRANTSPSPSPSAAPAVTKTAAIPKPAPASTGIPKPTVTRGVAPNVKTLTTTQASNKVGAVKLRPTSRFTNQPAKKP